MLRGLSHPRAGTTRPCPHGRLQRGLGPRTGVLSTWKMRGRQGGACRRKAVDPADARGQLPRKHLGPPWEGKPGPSTMKQLPAIPQREEHPLDCSKTKDQAPLPRSSRGLALSHRPEAPQDLDNTPAARSPAVTP